MPEHLYKYMTSNTAKLVLENRTLRWSTPSTLNDPYDIQFNLRIDFDRAKVVRLALEKSWEVYSGKYPVAKDSKLAPAMNLIRHFAPDMDKRFFFDMLSQGYSESFEHLDNNIANVWTASRTLLSTSKILCLTDSPLNQLMWAYYADGNKGAVLRFQKTDEKSPYKEAKPVRYSKHIPSLFSEDELSDFLSGVAGFDQQKRFDDLIYTKSDAWSHEREWRIFAGDGRDKLAPYEDIHFGEGELSAIILGCRMPESERRAIAELSHCLYPQAEILQACTANHKYELELTPYSN